MGGGDKPASPSKLDKSEVIRNENPELSKVLSEEPSSGKKCLIVLLTVKAQEWWGDYKKIMS